jgi:hypothetical protein
MKLCMFHPVDRPLERGWVGRIDGDHVTHLAAQTLEAYFTGGGTAREHAVYPIDAVRLLAPVLHPPSVRVFDDESSFWFSNPAAIVGPGAALASEDRPLAVLPRLVGVVGGDGRVGGFTLLAEWRRPHEAPPKDRDFALGLGPLVLTSDAFADAVTGSVRVEREERMQSALSPFDWAAACKLAARGTALRTGDLLAAPAWGVVEPVPPGARVEVEADVVGTLRQEVR